MHSLILGGVWDGDTIVPQVPGAHPHPSVISKPSSPAPVHCPRIMWPPDACALQSEAISPILILGETLLILQGQFQWHLLQKTSMGFLPLAHIIFYLAPADHWASQLQYLPHCIATVLPLPAQGLLQVREELIYSSTHDTRYVLNGCLMDE